MKVEKIKKWARIGQFAFWGYMLFGALFKVITEPSEIVKHNDIAFLLSFIGVGLYFLFSEAIVRLIIYFAELINKEN